MSPEKQKVIRGKEGIIMAIVDNMATFIISVIRYSNNCLWSYSFSSPPFFSDASMPVHNN